MSQPIDVAYVELEARGEKDAARDVKRAVDDMKNDVDRASKDMQKDLTEAFSKVGKDVERELGRVNDTVKKNAQDQRKAIDGVADALGDEFAEGAERAVNAIEQLTADVDAELKKTEKKARGAGKAIGDALGDEVRSGGLIQELARMGMTLRGISALLPSPLVAALVAALPAVIALGGALADLSALALLLPAGILGIVAATTTLKIAFQGVSDAVKALGTGDVDKIKKAMEGLAPSARAFARELFALQKPLGALRRTVQESFFRPLRGALTTLVTKALPTLQTGMSKIARSFGTLFRNVLRLLGGDTVLKSIRAVFGGVSRIIDGIRPKLTGFLAAFFKIAAAGMPFVERAFANLGVGLGKLTNWLSRIVADGSFEKFLNDAFAIMKDLGDLSRSVAQLLGALFGDAGDEGRSFIQTLTALIDRMTAFLNSAEGQEGLQRLLDSLPVMMGLLSGALSLFIVLTSIQQAWYEGLQAAGGAVVTAGKAIGDFFVMLWGWITTAGGAVGGFFASIGGFFGMLGGKIAEAWNAVVGFFGNVVTWLGALPGRIWTAIQAIPGIVVGVFKAAFDRATYLIGFAIGSIIGLTISLPGRIWGALQALGGVIRNVFTAARTTAINLVTSLVNTSVAFMTALPGRVWGAIRAVVSFVGSVFTSAKSRATSTVSSLVSTVVSFFRQLPGRAKSAISSLPGAILGVLRSIVSGAYSVGKDIINGIVNGIKDSVGSAIDAAKQAAKNILKGMKDAVGISSPSRVAAAEVGAPLAQGVGVGFSDELPDVMNVINQLTRDAVPDSTSVTNTRGGDRNVVLAAGAVQVTFTGVVPTAAEAARTGQLVGEQIARVLARRDVRVAVRTA